MGNAILRTANAGAGKTASIIDDIVNEKFLRPWQTVWVLLPTEAQVTAFQDRILTQFSDTQNEKVFFGVQFYTFYQLYNYLLDQMHSPQKQLYNAGVGRILRHIGNQLNAQGQLPYFHPVMDKAGLIALLTAFLFELKQAKIDPDQFSIYANHTQSLRERDIATVYSAYQAFLRERNLVDREGAGWLALAKLKAGDYPAALFDKVSLLVVDGFMQFSPLQAELLGELSQKVRRSVLTLTYDKNRAAGVHRVFERTRQRLIRYGTWREQVLTGTEEKITRRAELSHLEKHLFSPSAEKIAANDALLLIEAPDFEQESRAVLREVKALLLKGIYPEQIMIVARDIKTYAELLRPVALAYGVPVVFRQEFPLQDNPAVAMLLNLLDLHTPVVNFRRQMVMQVLRSPYFSPFELTAEDIEALEDISLRYQVVNSRDEWLRAVNLACNPHEDEEGDTVEAVADPGLHDRLQRFFERVTPPERAPVRALIGWLENLIGRDETYWREHSSHAENGAMIETAPNDHLRFFDNVRTSGDFIDYEMLIVRDIHALHGLRTSLLEVLAAYDLLASSGIGSAETAVEWQQFHADLQVALEHRRLEPVGGTNHSGRVLVTGVFESRGLPHDYVFVLGLAEGMFPAPNVENVLFGDRARQQLRALTGVELQTTAEQVDDTAVFYECCALAHQRLILSRPTLDERANLWAESVFWRAVQAVLSGAEKITYRAGQVPNLTQAADKREASLALAAALNHPEPAAEAFHVNRWLLTHPEQGTIWRSALRGRAIEAGRLDETHPPDPFSGVLHDPTLIHKVAEELNEQRHWSASQMNDYGYCPFRFFSKRLLKLEELEEPEEGFDSAQLGSLQHEILEHAYRYILENEVAILPENQRVALEFLQNAANTLLPDAPHRLGFRASALWRHEQEEIRQRLRRLVMLDFSDDAESPFVAKPRTKNIIAEIVEQSGHPRRVYALEKSFGFAGVAPVVFSGAAGNIRARGFIDRIDRVGNQLIIIDYKSGSQTPKTQDMEEGRNFQMMLYLAAAQQIVAAENPALQVAAGMFWSVRTRKASGQIRAAEESIRQALDRLHMNILAGRQGNFRNVPTKLEDGKCFRYCEYSRFCRLKSTQYNDTE